MAIALFMCLNDEVAYNMEANLPSSPEEILSFKQLGRLFFVRFDGSGCDMYWWGMDIANNSLNTISFIGVDEKSNTVRDECNLLTLGDLRLHNAHWDTKSFADAYSDLVSKFMSALDDVEITHDTLLRICQQSVFGLDANTSAEYCARAVQECFKFGRNFGYKSLLDPQNMYYWSSDAHCTLIRVMAHIYYLGVTARQSRGSSPAERFFRTIFGRS